MTLTNVNIASWNINGGALDKIPCSGIVSFNGQKRSQVQTILDKKSY